MENVHQISLTQFKVEVLGAVDVHYFDLDHGPMTLVLKLDLDMVLIYHCAKKKVSILSASKVRARTDTQTNIHDKIITSPHMRVVKMFSGC